MKPYRELWWPKFRPFLWITDDLPDTKRGRRKASNYGLWIRIRRDVYENEPWVFQQEVFESRYWMLRGFGLYYLFCRLFYPTGLLRFECMIRAQEIRARLDAIGPDMANSVAARSYARSITKDSNYPFFAAARWDEEMAFNEIMKWL